MSKRVVLKFGASSLKNTGRIKTVLDIISEQVTPGTNPVIVVSHFNGAATEITRAGRQAEEGDSGYIKTLESYIETHRKIVEELTGITKTFEEIDGIQEIITSLQQYLRGIYLLKDLSPKSLQILVNLTGKLAGIIVVAALKGRGTEARFVESHELITVKEPDNGIIIDQEETGIKTRTLLAGLEKVAVVSGSEVFYEGESFFLENGAADRVATSIAVSIDAAELQIWRTVDGVLTADPANIEKSSSIGLIGYEEAIELSRSGTKFFSASALEIARDARLTLSVKNSCNPGFSGTVISDTHESEKSGVTGISSIPEVSLFKIEIKKDLLLPGRIINEISAVGIPVLLLLLSFTEKLLSIAVNRKDSHKIRLLIEREFEKEIRTGEIAFFGEQTEVSLLSVLKQNICGTPGVAGAVFAALGKSGINVLAISMGSSETSLSLIVRKEDLSTSVSVIHDLLFSGD